MYKQEVTIGELIEAFYSESFKEFGDELLANKIAAKMVSDYLRRKKL